MSDSWEYPCPKCGVDMRPADPVSTTSCCGVRWPPLVATGRLSPSEARFLVVRHRPNSGIAKMIVARSQTAKPT